MVMLKASAMWCLLVGLAIANGAFRELVLSSHLSMLAAHQMSSALLALLIFLLTYWVIPWLRVTRTGKLLAIGVFWVVLSSGFEFGFGHYVMDQPWSLLFADYNLFAGRLLLLVWLSTFLSPLLAARLRRCTWMHPY